MDNCAIVVLTKFWFLPLQHSVSARHSGTHRLSPAPFCAHCAARRPPLCHSAEQESCRAFPTHPCSASFYFIRSFWCARSITYCVFRVNYIKIIHSILQSHPIHSQHSAQEYPPSSRFLTVTCDTVFLCFFSRAKWISFSTPSSFHTRSILFLNILLFPRFSLITFLYLLYKQNKADRFRSASFAHSHLY